MKISKLMLVILLLALLQSAGALAFKDGEKLTFKVKYGPAYVGGATFEIKSSSYQGNSVWYISTNARTYPFFDKFFKVRDKVESWWDKDTLLPYKSAKTMQEGSYRQHRLHIFDQANLKTTYQKWSYKKKEWINEEQTLPAVSQDVLSAFYQVRNQNLVPGKSHFVNITTDGLSVNSEVVVHRREKISSIFGMINCLVIEPRISGSAVFKQSGKILIWVSDDAWKIPIKVESAVAFGSFVAHLSDAQNVSYIIKYPDKK